MAKVSLRIYNREIETLVDSGQLDEAIAHCRHILNAYPKHLETYRMIGKAYLEAKRYDEATDIFERILMAVPDDFVAHVGMSIIRDEQKSMDEAIWYMQRAFEVQPSNSAIQAELQRLYGRRDGIEPPKIRLTRGALSHMYVQGELYPQAISEIKAVLDEDPERQDMQVLLARAYFHSGQQSESAEMCAQLLRRYPYCFDANRVLVELLPQTERGESVQVYRDRVNELDPYAPFVTGSVFHTEEVSDAAVSLERLEWSGQPVDVQPEWSDSLGIGRSEETAASDAEPDWLKSGLTPEAPTASTSSDEPASDSGSLPVSAANNNDDIPEFLRDAGWSEDTGTFQEGANSLDTADDSSAEPTIAEGDLPDWVKAMAPIGAGVEDMLSQAESTEDLTQDDVPDWLQGLGDAQSTSDAEQPLAADTDMPDWLGSTEQAGEAPSPAQEQTMAEPISDNDLPDWLKPELSEEEQAASQDAPQEPMQESPQELVQETPGTSDESLSDWQFGDEALASAVDFDTTDTGTLGTSAEEQDDAVAWLEGLASKHGAKSEELVTDPEARKETAPDWVQEAQSLQEQGQAEVPVAEEPAQPVEPAASPAAPFSADDLGTSAEEQDDAVAWLEGLAAKHGAKSEELVTDPEARTETAPDWVQKAQSMGEQDQAEMPVAEESAQPVEQAAPPAASVSADDLGTSAEEQDDAVAWLEGLASKHGAKPEELVTDPDARTETAPDWVQKATEASSESAIGERPTAPPAEEPADSEPDWMKQAKDTGESLYEELEEAHTKEPLPSAESDETGMWLRDLGEEGGFSDDQSEQPTGEGDVPDWLSGLDSEAATPDAAPEAEAVSEMESAPETEAAPEPAEAAESEPPDWLQSMEADVSGTDAPPTSKDEASLPDWLGDMESAQFEAGGAPAPPLEEAASELGQEVPDVEATAPADEPGITDWLQKVETESSETQAGEPAAETVEDTAADDLPSWLAGLDGDGETEQPQPEAGSDTDLPEWLRPETEQEPTPAEPTTPTDWMPVDAAAPPEAEPLIPTPEPEREVEAPPVQAAPPPAPEPEPEPTPEPSAPPAREPYREPVTRSRTGMTGMLSAAQDPGLTEAQNELTRGNIPGAMESYGKLIKKGKLLEEIIFDLREALYRYPVEVAILQALGDAYMRANRLQEALDSYTKAEELLR